MPHPTLTTDVVWNYAERLASLLGEDLLRVSLFGSRARGEAGSRSDFVLMVVLRRASGENRDVVHGLATEIELEHGIDLSTKITDEERFERLRRSALPFWRHFNRDEEVLWFRNPRVRASLSRIPLADLAQGLQVVGHYPGDDEPGNRFRLLDGGA